MDLSPSEKNLIKDAVDEGFKQTIVQLTKNAMDGTMPSQRAVLAMSDNVTRRRNLLERMGLV